MKTMVIFTHTIVKNGRKPEVKEVMEPQTIPTIQTNQKTLKMATSMWMKAQAIFIPMLITNGAIKPQQEI